MPKLQLSDFQQAVNKKFSDFEIFAGDEVIAAFLPALRLPKERRRELAAVLDIPARAATDNGDDVFDVYKDAFRVSERTPGDFDRLAEAFGDDPALWQELFHEFIEATQAGEA